MSNALAQWLAQSRVALLVASGVVVAASTTAGVVLSQHDAHTRVLGEKFAQPNSGGSAGAGSGTAAEPFTMTVHAVGTVAPGQSQTLNVAVRNPNGQNMAITAASGVVNSVSKPGCLARWFTVEDWTPSASPTIVPANGTSVIEMKLDFTDDVSTNQDTCKSTAASPVTIGFTLHATGVQA